MSNALFYEDCALNYTQSPLDDSITSGCKGWSSAKINCLMDSAHSEINETIQTCHNAVVSCLNSSVTSINTDLSNKYAVCCDSCVRIGQNSCVGNYGVSIGYGAGSYSSSYMYTVAIGGTARALGNYGISVGYQAGASFTGANNLAIGTYAMYGASGATGCNNTAIGYNALRNIQGTANNDNTAIGSSALQAMTTGLYNTAIGARALCGLTTGCENFGLGIDTGWAITTGCNNVLIGNNAGMGITGDSSENVLIGKNVACTGGCVICGNTIIGSKAGTNVVSCDNVIIGNGADIDIQGTVFAYNCGNVVIGSCAKGGLYDTVLGAYACSTSAYNTVIGRQAYSGGQNNIAINARLCCGNNNIVVGFGTNAKPTTVLACHNCSIIIGCYGCHALTCTATHFIGIGSVCANGANCGIAIGYDTRTQYAGVAIGVNTRLCSATARGVAIGAYISPIALSARVQVVLGYAGSGLHYYAKMNDIICDFGACFLANICYKPAIPRTIVNWDACVYDVLPFIPAIGQIHTGAIGCMPEAFFCTIDGIIFCCKDSICNFTEMYFVQETYNECGEDKYYCKVSPNLLSSNCSCFSYQFLMLAGIY
jgi:hypothetical protein